MSVFSGIRDAVRSVGKISATGFKTLGVAVYGLGNIVVRTMKTLYNACSNWIQAFGRSYAKGVRYSYYASQGHLVTGPASATLPAMTPVEKGLHFTISLAGLWGVMGAFFVHCAGTLRDTVKSIISAMYASLRRTAPQPSYQEGAEPPVEGIVLTPPSRHPFVKYVVGFPGLVLGAIVGSVAATVWANMLAVSYMVSSMTRYATGLFQGFNPGYHDRLKPLVRFGLGLPGTVLGALIGLIPATVIGVARALKYMAWTCGSAFKSTVGFPLTMMTHPEPFHQYMKDCDTQMCGVTTSFYRDENYRLVQANLQAYTRFQVYVLGAPGILLGTILALPFASVVTMAGMFRFFAHSYHDVFRLMINVVVPKREEWYPYNRNPMTPIQRVLFGLPGYILGAATAMVVCTLVVVGRTTLNSASAFRLSVSPAFNWAWGAQVFRTRPQDWRLVHKGFAVPGFLLGGVSAAIVVTSIAIVRTAINSARLFRSLAGGAFNMAWGYPVFKTNPKDWQHANRWGFGIPGMILASPVVVLSAVFFVSKYTVAAVMAIAAAPLVAIFRAGREAWKITHEQLAFQGLNVSEEDPAAKVHHVMHRFFSALSISGQLPVGAALVMPREDGKNLSIPPSATYTHGFKAVLKFLRKCFTFNAQTDDERLLHGIYAELKIAMAVRTTKIPEDLGDAIRGAVEAFLKQAEDMDIANRFEAEERKIHANNVGRAIATALGASYPDSPRAAVVEGAVVGEPAVVIDRVAQPACYGQLFFADRGYTTQPAAPRPTPTPASAA